MLVLGANTKRQRQRSVRLGEIGEGSASLCGKSSFSKPKFDKQISEVEADKIKPWNNCGSPRDSLDTQNWENCNPNSKEYDLGLEEANIINLGMGFGIVNRKRRVMRQRGWAMEGGAVTKAWRSMFSPEISYKNELPNGCGYFNGKSVITGRDPAYDHLNHDYRDRDEVDCKGDSNHSLQGTSWEQELDSSSDDGQCLRDKMGVAKKPKPASITVNSVDEWLMQLGFSKYAALFEMHEVDMEALPLLTFGDLIEMGIPDMGTRRRMCSAIRLLRNGINTT